MSSQSSDDIWFVHWKSRTLLYRKFVNEDVCKINKFLYYKWIDQIMEII